MLMRLAVVAAFAAGIVAGGSIQAFDVWRLRHDERIRVDTARRLLRLTDTMKFLGDRCDPEAVAILAEGIVKAEPYDVLLRRWEAAKLAAVRKEAP
jgi:hypothetical protein